MQQNLLLDKHKILLCNLSCSCISSETIMMMKKYFLQIPEPCHEDWSTMTTVQQGKFCKSCCKTVTDFSNMSDKQILAVLTKAAGSTCGRFTNNQLDRRLQLSNTPAINPYKIFFSALIPAFLFAGKANAQKGKEGLQTKTEIQYHITGDTEVIRKPLVNINGTINTKNDGPAAGASIIIKGTKLGVSADKYGRFKLEFPPNQKEIILDVSFVGYQSKQVSITHTNQTIFIELELESMILGKIMYVPHTKQKTKIKVVLPPKEIIIKGTVINEIGEPLSYATILYKGKGITTLSDGTFQLQASKKIENIELTTSYAGHEEATTLIDLNAGNNQGLTIVLKKISTPDPVPVTCNLNNSQLVSRVGGVSMVRTFILFDTLKTTAIKILKQELFKINPNPVFKDQRVQLIFKKPGIYQLQLFSNDGKSHLQKEINTEGKIQQYLLELPTELSAGIYYLKAINLVTKKQFTDKLVVQ